MAILVYWRVGFFMRLWGWPCWKWARYLASVAAMPSRKTLMGQSSYWLTGSEISKSVHNTLIITGHDADRLLTVTQHATSLAPISAPGCSWGSRLVLSTPSISRSMALSLGKFWHSIKLADVQFDDSNSASHCRRRTGVTGTFAVKVLTVLLSSGCEWCFIFLHKNGTRTSGFRM